MIAFNMPTDFIVSCYYLIEMLTEMFYRAPSVGTTSKALSVHLLDFNVNLFFGLLLSSMLIRCTDFQDPESHTFI